MAVFRGGQGIGPHDDAPADTFVRPTVGADDDLSGRPASALVAVIVGEDSPVTRYASWLADAYETQIARCGETISPRPETEALVVDRRTLTIAGGRARGPIGRRRSDCRVLAPATLQQYDSLVDEYISEPVSRDGLLGRVETALRMATYDATIAELLSLTIRRRRLRTRSDTDCVDHGSDIAALSERIDELHRHIDNELSNVESQYAVLLGRRHRTSSRRKTEDESV